jgi:hypothetical protein
MDQRFPLIISIFRQEFIFRVLKHLVIGGGMCQVPRSFRHPNFAKIAYFTPQFDDEWKPYADTVLAM